MLKLGIYNDGTQCEDVKTQASIACTEAFMLKCLLPHYSSITTWRWKNLKLKMTLNVTFKLRQFSFTSIIKDMSNNIM
jgi:hypothetical protein